MINRSWTIFLIALIGSFLGSPLPLLADELLHLAFMIGEDEYKTWETLPAFARQHLEPRDVKCTFINAPPEDPSRFEGIESLDQCDELFLSVRRRPLPKDDMNRLKQFLAAGKPLVAIRTACHAFSARPGSAPPKEELVEWTDFDRAVLGVHYLGHFANRDGTEIRLAPGAQHNPLVSSIGEAGFHSGGTLYKFADLNSNATLLLQGTTVDQGKALTMPVAWTYEYKKARVFYTSLGQPDDFKLPEFNSLLVNAIFWAAERIPPHMPK